MSLRALCVAIFISAASSSWAAFVTWELNPNSLNQNVGSASNVYTVQGFNITAYGFDYNPGGTNTPRELYYKSEPFGTASERGLGLVGTDANELNVSNGVPLQFMQISLGPLLAAGFFNGQININSVQNGESFQLYGSNVLGQLGVALGGPFPGLANDNVFVNIPDFGVYQYLTIAAATGRVLPNAFRAELVPIPEAASFVPVLILVIAATVFEAHRRRRATA